MNADRFAVKFRNSTKVAYIENHADFYESIHKIYQGNLPRLFWVKYDDKEFAIVDLGSTIQFPDRKSDILYIEEEVSDFQNASSESTEYNPESSRSLSSSLSQWVIFSIKFICSTCKPRHNKKLSRLFFGTKIIYFLWFFWSCHI